MNIENMKNCAACGWVGEDVEGMWGGICPNCGGDTDDADPDLQIKPWRVQVLHDRTLSTEVTVFGADAEAACNNAIVEAASRGDWDWIDDASDPWIGMVQEGDTTGDLWAGDVADWERRRDAVPAVFRDRQLELDAAEKALIREALELYFRQMSPMDRRLKAVAKLRNRFAAAPDGD